MKTIRVLNVILFIISIICAIVFSISGFSFMDGGGFLGFHTHAYNMRYDSGSHWEECNCGKKINEKAHVGGGDSCTVCNCVYTYTEGVVYDVSSDGTYAEVIGYSGTDSFVRIARTYQGLTVKSIYNEAFKNTKITSVVIPDSVTSIGSMAFAYCDSLTNIYITDIAAWCKIWGLVNLMGYGLSKNLYLNNVLVTNLIIPDSVTSIGSSAFSGCSSLTSLTFQDTSTWYRVEGYTNWQNKTGGSQVGVTDPSTNVSRFRSDYSCYWYKL